jgi:hypothetical protein
MLSDRTIREINDQIQREVRDARTSFDHDEKLACYERIAALKSALDPQPTRGDILTELAEALAGTTPTHAPQTTPADALITAICNLRRR